MTPNTLTLENFHGIKAGTGLDVITLDIDALAGDASLILLKGDNGSGKTTVLDNLQPYRLMPSKAGGYSPKSFSYYGETYGDALKDLVWTHNGKQYRSVINIKGSLKAKKTEAYLQERAESINGDSTWVYVSFQNGLFSDGKTVTYDACVEHILGSPEMFFTAAFSSQERRKLSSYSNADIKALMAELLALGDITELGENAAVVLKMLTARVNGIRIESTMFKGKRDTRDSFESAMQAAIIEQTESISAVAAARLALDYAFTHLQETKRLAEDRIESQKKRDALTEHHQKIGLDLTKRVGEIEADIQTEEQRKASATIRYRGSVDDIQQRIKIAQSGIKEKEDLLLRSDEVALACTRVGELQVELEQQERDGQSARVRSDKLKEISRAYVSACAEYETTKTTLDNSVAAATRLVKSASLAVEVPCKDMPFQGDCKLLQDALKAKDAIPNQETVTQSARVNCDVYQNKKDTLAAEVGLHADADQELQKTIERYRVVSTELGNVKAVAALKAAVDAAEIERDRFINESDRLHEGLAETEHERDKLFADIDCIVRTKHERITLVEQQAKLERDTIVEQLNQIPAGDSSALDAAQAEHQKAHELFATVTDAETSIKERIAANRERVDVLDKELYGETKLLEEGERLNAEVAHWQLLTKALGRDGIVALCIDDAGPTLASLTNDLLLSCYGPRFTVAIETQSETAKGTTREGFDIRVFDGDTDEDKSVTDMSGGEKIYINEAMTRAIALYQAQQSGQQYGTLFSDESDGALDPKRKVMFTSMKRKVLELGGYEREIFITHTPELWDLADAVIDMNEVSA